MLGTGEEWSTIVLTPTMVEFPMSVSIQAAATMYPGTSLFLGELGGGVRG